MTVAAVPTEDEDLVQQDDIIREPGAGLAPVGSVTGGVPGSVDAQIDEAVAAENPGPASDPKAIIAPAPTMPAPGAVDPNIVPPEAEGPPVPNAATDAILAKLPPASAPTGTPPVVAPAGPLGTTVGPDGEPIAAPTPEGLNEKQTALEKAKAEDALLQADDARKAALDHHKEMTDALEHGNAVVQRRQQSYDDSLAKYQGMQIRDYYDDPTHSRFTAALGIALGGLGAAFSAAGGGSAENRVLTQVNKKIEDDYQRQKFQIDKARDSVVMAHTGIDDAKEAKAAMLEDVAAKRTATYDALEKEARQQLAERGMSQPAIDSDQRILALQAQRRAAQIDADKRQRQEAMDAAREHLMAAQADRAEAMAALQAKKAKGGSGGGGGGMKPGAAAAFKGAIEDGTVENGVARPLTAREIQQKADELGIPATAKAGRPSVENLTKDVAFVKGEGRKAGAADAKLDEAMRKELYTPKGPGTQLERIEAMRDELKGAIASGDKTAATRVLEEAGGMLSGGKSTKTTVDLLHQLKSTQDTLSSAWGRITGNPGDTKEFTQRLDKLLEGTAGEKRAEVAAIQKRYGKAPAATSGTSAAPAKPTQMKVGNSIYTLQPDGTYK